MKKFKIKLKRKIKDFWFWNIKGHKLSERQKRFLKTNFRWFFEGYDYMDEPVIDIPIPKFGITNLRFREFKDKIVFEITLERPGILIGKGGRCINSLTEHLTERMSKKVEILIKESKLWW